MQPVSRVFASWRRLGWHFITSRTLSVVHQFQNLFDLFSAHIVFLYVFLGYSLLRHILGLVLHLNFRVNRIKFSSSFVLFSLDQSAGRTLHFFSCPCCTSRFFSFSIVSGNTVDHLPSSQQVLIRFVPSVLPRRSLPLGVHVQLRSLPPCSAPVVSFLLVIRFMVTVFVLLVARLTSPVHHTLLLFFPPPTFIVCIISQSPLSTWFSKFSHFYLYSASKYFFYDIFQAPLTSPRKISPRLSSVFFLFYCFLLLAQACGPLPKKTNGNLLTSLNSVLLLLMKNQP